MHTELVSSQVEVQRCTLSWAVGEELGDELARLARRKWRWSKAEVEVEEAEARRTARGQLVAEEEEEEEAGMRSDKI